MLSGMPDYSDTVRAHFRAPRNIGEFPADSGLVFAGMAGARRHGREVEFRLRLAPGHRVSDCRYRVYGCPATIALCSLASEAIKGRTLAEVTEFSVVALAEELALPAEKRDAALTVEDAIRAAAMRYNATQAPLAGVPTAATRV